MDKKQQKLKDIEDVINTTHEELLFVNCFKYRDDKKYLDFDCVDSKYNIISNYQRLLELRSDIKKSDM
jgi:hypothetical protein